MHTLSAFLFGDHPDWGQAPLYERIRSRFAAWKGLVIEELWRPFQDGPALDLSIGRYHITLNFIDEEVQDSLAHVQRVTGQSLPAATLRAELRANFDDDPHQDFDELAVEMYAFLMALPQAVVFDDRQQQIVARNLPAANAS